MIKQDNILLSHALHDIFINIHSSQIMYFCSTALLVPGFILCYKPEVFTVSCNSPLLPPPFF